MAGLGDLLVRIDASTEQLRRELARADSSLATTQSSIDRKLGAIDARFSRLGAAISRTFSGLLGPIAAALGVQKLIQYADTWSLIQGRLKLVTDSTADLANVTGQLFEQAQATRLDFGLVADLYARLARNTRELGLEQKDVLRLTEALNQAVVVSGATAQEASAGLIQLSQGFASGTLRGEELNSVLEQLPRVAEAIAEGLGVTIGQLRAMGKAGQLTGEQVAKALLGQADKIAKEFAEMPVTVGQALTRLNNAFLSLVGGSNEAIGATSALAEAISGLAEIVGSDELQDAAAGFFTQFVTQAEDAAKSISDAFSKARDARRAAEASGNDSGLAIPEGVLQGAKAVLDTIAQLEEQIGILDPNLTNLRDSLEKALTVQVPAPDVSPFSEALKSAFDEITALDARIAMLKDQRIALDARGFSESVSGIDDEIVELNRKISEVGQGSFAGIDNTLAVTSLRGILNEVAEVDAALAPLSTRKLVIEVEMGRLDQLIQEANAAGESIDALVAQREALELEYHSLSPQIAKDIAKLEELKKAAKFVIEIPIQIGDSAAFNAAVEEARDIARRAALPGGRDVFPPPTRVEPRDAKVAAGETAPEPQTLAEARADEARIRAGNERLEIEKKLETVRTKAISDSEREATAAAEAPLRFAEAVESLRTEVTNAALPAEFQKVAAAATAAGVDIKEVLPAGVFEKVAAELAASGVDITQSLKGASGGVEELSRQFQILEGMSEGPEKQTRLFDALAQSAEFVGPKVEQARSSFESLMDELDRVGTSTDRYAEAQAEIAHDLAIGAINAEQYAEALAKIEATLSPAAQKLRAFADQMEATGDTIGSSIDDSFANLVLGIESAHDVAISLLRDIAKEAIKAAQIAALGQTFGQAIGGVIGGLFTGGAAPTGPTNAPHGGRVQLGGPVQRGKSYDVAEDGKPELFVGRSVSIGVSPPITNLHEMAEATGMPETAIGRLTRTRGGRAVLGLMRSQDQQATAAPKSRGIKILGKSGQPETFQPPEDGTVIPATDLRAIQATPAGKKFLKKVGRALGGPVRSGETYDVAEDHKLELFVGRSVTSGVPPVVTRTDEMAAATDLPETVVRRLSRTPGGRTVLNLIREREDQAAVVSQSRGIEVLGQQGKPQVFKPAESGYVLPNPDVRALESTPKGHEFLERAGRADGGPVQAGRSYDVAEDRKPELFVGRSVSVRASKMVTRTDEMVGLPETVVRRLARTPGGRAVLGLIREREDQTSGLRPRGIEVLGKQGKPEVFKPSESGYVLPNPDFRALEATPKGSEFLARVGRVGGGPVQVGRSYDVAEDRKPEIFVGRSVAAGVPSVVTRVHELATAAGLPETVVRRLSRTPGGRAVLSLIQKQGEQTAPVGQRQQGVEVLDKQGKPKVFKAPESGYVLPNTDFRALESTSKGREFLARAGRAKGGPVLTGRSYDVAEDKRPELFVGRSATARAPVSVPNLHEAAKAAGLPEATVGRLARTPGGRAILELLRDQQQAGQPLRGIQVLGKREQPETFKAPESGDILPSPDFRALEVTTKGRGLLAKIGRVSGGPVQAGKPYDIAEDKRSELFVGRSATFGAPSSVTRLHEMATATGVPDTVVGRLARTPGGRAVLGFMHDQDGQAATPTVPRAKRGIEILGKRGQPETFVAPEDGTVIPAGDLRAIQATPAGRKFLETVGRVRGGLARSGEKLIVGEDGRRELWVPDSALPEIVKVGDQAGPNLVARILTRAAADAEAPALGSRPAAARGRLVGRDRKLAKAEGAASRLVPEISLHRQSTFAMNRAAHERALALDPVLVQPSADAGRAEQAPFVAGRRDDTPSPVRDHEIGEAVRVSVWPAAIEALQTHVTHPSTEINQALTEVTRPLTEAYQAARSAGRAGQPIPAQPVSSVPPDRLPFLLRAFAQLPRTFLPSSPALPLPEELPPIRAQVTPPLRRADQIPLLYVRHGQTSLVDLSPVERALQPQPDLGAVAEQPADAERQIGRYRRVASTKLIELLPRAADLARGFRDREAQIISDDLGDHQARMTRENLPAKHGVVPALAARSEIQIPSAALVRAIAATRTVIMPEPSTGVQASLMALPGARGELGATGVQGASGGRGGEGGLAGLPGSPGAPGSLRQIIATVFQRAGQAVAAGLSGVHGKLGTAGVQGASGGRGGDGGLAGLPGIPGAVGASALAGMHGSAGGRGGDGGAAGLAGIAGAVGAAALAGMYGAAGAPGVAGGRGGDGGQAGLAGIPGAVGAAALTGAHGVAGAPGAAGGRGGDGGQAGLPGAPGTPGTAAVAVMAAFQHGGPTVPGKRGIAGEQPRGIELWLPRSWTVARLEHLRPDLRVRAALTGRADDDVRHLHGDQPELLGAQAAEPFEAAKPGTVIPHRETIAILRRLGVDPAKATRTRELSTEGEITSQRGGGRSIPEKPSLVGESGLQLYLPPSWTVDRLNRTRPELPVEGPLSTSDVRQLPGTRPELLGARGAEVFEAARPGVVLSHQRTIEVLRKLRVDPAEAGQGRELSTEVEVEPQRYRGGGRPPPHKPSVAGESGIQLYLPHSWSTSRLRDVQPDLPIEGERSTSGVRQLPGTQPELLGARGAEIFETERPGAILSHQRTLEVFRRLGIDPAKVGQSKTLKLDKAEELPAFAEGGRPKPKKLGIAGERGIELYLPSGWTVDRLRVISPKLDAKGPSVELKGPGVAGISARTLQGDKPEVLGASGPEVFRSDRPGTILDHSRTLAILREIDADVAMPNARHGLPRVTGIEIPRYQYGGSVMGGAALAPMPTTVPQWSQRTSTELHVQVIDNRRSAESAPVQVTKTHGTNGQMITKIVVADGLRQLHQDGTLPEFFRQAYGLTPRGR